MLVTSRERQLLIVPALQPLASHHLFPMQALPAWALPRVSGTWKSLKGVLTTDIRDLFGRERSGDYSATTDISEVEDLSDIDPDASLYDKLKEDVSMNSIRALLTHEIKLFRTKDGDDSDGEDPDVELEIDDPA